MNQPDSFLRTDPLPSDLANALSEAAGRLGMFSRQVQWYEELDSTNSLASAFAALGMREGAVVIAGTQTAGRGRLGRPWHSPPDAGLYVSVVLRPHARALPLVTIAAGVALADGIRAATGLTAALKWPNDLYFGARKLAGILAETGRSTARLQDDGLQGVISESAEPHVALGFGVNLRPAAYPPDVAARATSLEGEAGRAIDRGIVLVECLAALGTRYDDLLNDRTGSLLDAWREYARPLLGRTVEWDAGAAQMRGVAEDIDGSGALLVRSPSGIRRLIAGDVRWT